jgi:hypothetical protein
LLLPLYLCSLALGLLQNWPLGLAASRGALRNPFVAELARGSGDAVATLFMGNPSAAALAGVWGFAALLGAMFLGLAYNFFAGGILSAYAGTGRFWAGCRSTFWSFTGLGLLLALLAGLIVAVSAVLSSFLGVRSGVIMGLALLQLLNVLGEYARALAVTRGRRNPFVLLGTAVGFSVGHLPGVLLLALIGLLLHLGLAALYSVVAGLLGASPLLPLWGQSIVFAWLWVKFLRLGWALSYTETSDTEQATATPVPAVLPPATMSS